jgi:putative N6-adenine-specific DNA methylase
MNQYTLIATTPFGLEAVVKRELTHLGFSSMQVENGIIRFLGTKRDIVRCNIWLRSADRVYIEITKFKATTFDQLYDEIKRVHWQNYIDKDGKILLDAISVKSKLYSLRDIQKISKKAIADRLMFFQKANWLSEKGALYRVRVTIHKDFVTVWLDSSGDGLHKRGYRVQTVEAPLKETLAAALIQLSFWNPSRFLYDVFCGSGTIPIEAALMAKNIAPGLTRDFAFNNWSLIPQDVIKDVKKEAYQGIKHDVKQMIYASDINTRNLEAAKQNAIEAGVDDIIQFSVRDFREVDYQRPYAVLITNPPYGERLLQEREVIDLTKDMKKIFSQLHTWNLNVFTSMKQFEKLFKTADRRRKIYNGRIESWYYQYKGPKPPAKESNNETKTKLD